MNNGYNGWTNYPTWRVNLELFDGMTVEDMGINPDPDTRDDDIADLAAGLEAFAHDTVEAEASGWALDIATSFLADVDWQEIAEHMIDDYLAENN